MTTTNDAPAVHLLRVAQAAEVLDDAQLERDAAVAAALAAGVSPEQVSQTAHLAVPDVYAIADTWLPSQTLPPSGPGDVKHAQPHPEQKLRR